MVRELRCVRKDHLFYLVFALHIINQQAGKVVLRVALSVLPTPLCTLECTDLCSKACSEDHCTPAVYPTNS
jgi:hypothetical protein